MSRFCWDVPDPWGCSKSLHKKSLCAFFVPYYPPPSVRRLFKEHLTGCLRWGDGLTGVLVGVSVGILVGVLVGTIMGLL